jgi:hypothetical protein
MVMTAVLQVPYALGYTLARPGLEFTGVIMNPEDSQSYFAKMLQGYDGRWLYTIPFTTEEHAPAFVGGFYLALGHLARALGWSLEAMWLTARVVADLILFLAIFRFIAIFLQDLRARWTAYLLALFGSGLGWLLFLLNQPYWLDWFPVDFKMPEAHVFFAALTFPHVALGMALILASFWFVKQAAGSGQQAASSRQQAVELLYAIGAGLANLALAIVYPFLIYLVALTVGIYWLYLVARARRVLWRQAITLAATFALPAPLVLYYASTLATNAVYRAWDAQSITLSPPLPHYLVAYGVMVLLAVLLCRPLTTDRRPQIADGGLRSVVGGQETSFLWVWVIAVALLVYAPLNPQRRFVEGVHVPLTILATVGLCDTVLPWLGQTRAFRWLAARPRYSAAGLERLAIVAFLVFMSLSNVYILASTSITAALQQPYPLFRSRAEIEAVNWLREHTARDQVVLGAYETGNYIAAHAGNRVVLGHWAETLDGENKFDQVKDFYGAMDDAVRRALLSRYRVGFVWLGAQERKLGGFDLERADYLEPVFANSEVTISQVHR